MSRHRSSPAPVVIDPDLQAQVDRLLMDQGHYDPLELLLVEGRLFYEDYERWRCGETATLDEAWLGDPERIHARLAEAEAYVRALGLVAGDVAPHGWGPASAGAVLAISADPALDARCRTQFQPRRETPQLDLFFDNTEVALVNRVRAALIHRRSEAAREALDALLRHAPHHPAIGALERLYRAARATAAEAPEAFIRELEEAVVPLATEHLSTGARDYLVPLWQRLAEGLAGRPFDGARPQLHASYAAAQALDWRRVREAVEGEADWPFQPVLLRRHGLACFFSGDRAQARRDWYALGWRFADELAQVLAAKDFPDPHLRRLWRAFEDLEPPLPVEDFPAWLLLADPSLAMEASQVTVPDTPAGQAFDLIARLLRAAPGSRRDADVITLRRRLKAIHPRLFEIYLALRR